MPRLRQLARAAYHGIGIEPMVLMFSLGSAIILGGDLDTRFLLYKVCLMEFNGTETVCRSLQEEQNTMVLQEVSDRALVFQQIMDFLVAVPAFVYAICLGGIADTFGIKIPMYLAVGGMLAGSVLDILAAFFVRQLPIEFFFVQNVYYFCGGEVTYYLGMYTYGALKYGPETRAMRLAFYDAIGSASKILGTFLSPLLYKWFDYVGVFSIVCAVRLVNLLYVILRVKDPVTERAASPEMAKLKEMNLFGKIFGVFWQLFVKQGIAVVKTMSRKRPDNIRFLLLLQCFLYGLFYFYYSHFVYYIYYFQLVLNNYDETQSSYYHIIVNATYIVSLGVFVPLLWKRWGIHATIINSVVCGTEALSKVLMAFAKNYWQMYLARLVGLLEPCVYSLTRAIIYQMVEPHEYGKCASAVGMLSALAWAISNPSYKTIYRNTQYTFPGAFLLLAAAVTSIAGLLNLVMVANRKKIPHNPEIKAAIGLAEGETEAETEVEEKKENAPSHSAT